MSYTKTTPPSQHVTGSDEMLRLAVAAVLAADTEFRSQIPKGWDGDPLSDEIDVLRRAFEGKPAPQDHLDGIEDHDNLQLEVRSNPCAGVSAYGGADPRALKHDTSRALPSLAHSPRVSVLKTEGGEIDPTSVTINGRPAVWDDGQGWITAAKDNVDPAEVVFASRHNEETGECETVEIEPAKVRELRERLAAVKTRRYAPISDDQIRDIMQCGDVSTARIKIARLIHNETIGAKPLNDKMTTSDNGVRSPGKTAALMLDTMLGTHPAFAPSKNQASPTESDDV